MPSKQAQAVHPVMYITDMLTGQLKAEGRKAKKALLFHRGLHFCLHFTTNKHAAETDIKEQTNPNYTVKNHRPQQSYLN